MHKQLLALFLFFGAIPSDAQPSGSPLPNGIVGVPYSTDLGDGLPNIPQIPGLQVTYSYSLASGTNLPPGLAVSPSGLISGTPTQSGMFAFTVNFAFSASLFGQNVNLFLPIFASLEVSGSTGSPVVAIPGGLIFALTQSSPSAMQAISVVNRSSVARAYTVSTGPDAAPLLTLDSSNGTTAAFGTASVIVKANATGLSAGTYTNVVTVGVPSTGEKFDTRVIATVASTVPFILLSQTGLRFQGVVGGGKPLPQSITVVDPGPTTVGYSVSTATISGGKWLNASPASGSSSFSTPSTVQVSVDPTGLAPGDYYGQVLFVPNGIAGLIGTSTIAAVVLNVFSADRSPGADVQPAGLLTVGKAPAANPATKTILVANPSPTPVDFTTALFLDAPGKWLTVSPASGTVSTASPVPLSIQANVAGLAPGAYRGEVDLVFVQDRSVRHVAVLLIVLPASPGSAPEPAALAPVPGCTPAQLLLVPTVLPTGRLVAGFPASIEVSVADNCGTPLTAGTVTASFSSGDPQLSLLSLLDGRWAATWEPRTTGDQVTITVRAHQTLPALDGLYNIGGAVQANSTTPVISAGGAVSAASFAAQQPLAPGSYIAIFGSRLSAALNQSPSLPLAQQLGGTQVLLAGEVLPLQFASDGQINAIVPFDVQVNSTQSLLVQNGSTLSNPEMVAIAPAQPAVFTKDRTGKGAAIVTGFKPDGSLINSGQVLDSSNPASAGDTIVIYCAGLGMVNPPVGAGQAAPLSPLSQTVNPVRVTIGGQEANVKFAGLAPNFAGLYQINAIVPAGITSGNPDLVVIVAAQQSTPVTIPIR